MNAVLQPSGLSQTAGAVQQAGIGFEHGGQALHLAEGVAVAAPHVVVRHAGTGHDVSHLQSVARSAGYARADDAVRRETTDQFGRAQGSVHLADAAAGQDEGVAAQAAFHIVIEAARLLVCVREVRGQTGVLVLHRVDDSYLHC